MSLWSMVSQGTRGSYFLLLRTAWRTAPQRQQLLYAPLHFLIFHPSCSHHFSFLALEPQMFPFFFFSFFAAVWMQIGRATFCRFNLGKSPAFCVTHERPCGRSKMKDMNAPRWAWAGPLSDIPPLSTQRSRTHSAPNWAVSSLCANGRNITDDGAATQRFLQVALWKMRNRDTIYPRCVACQCLCSCNAS